ncbi:GNAT family N-acetyltransferase [Aspergillus clavatus NRRL 1]|uniref:GNAT family acetyltransferase, putative n=1 Tax=Aspergillus clavatus (strain ATCC 1007 / CBS 513.65 / DSM 816 / NCTC 3887 / NRRL 1 / QM 1276 / 107) TaxID=344612 RepID=A1CMI6_ASPCL|nr:GNAT family acetyltransferase, putative [Aspergillus clavatus NRRL 1]EAW08773.1 GNAT family acetyltransferase, putative [Aspergillus clavatus NRRL 1]
MTTTHKTWTKPPYLISTDPSPIPLSTLNTWFASEELYWAKPLPEETLSAILHNSLCFGLYKTTTTIAAQPEPEFIGLARCITDHYTFAYLTDVYVLSAYQGQGLGTWLVECVGATLDAMPDLRRSMLLTMDWERSVPFYEKVLGMNVVESRLGEDGRREGAAVMSRRGRGSTSWVP